MNGLCKATFGEEQYSLYINLEPCGLLFDTSDDDDDEMHVPPVTKK